MKHPLHITSEIGELRTVLLHRPGREVENLTPEYLERLLFDDIPYLPAIQKEHDYFAQTLRNRGIEVVYLETLLAEALHNTDLREQFIEDILEESKANVNSTFYHLKEYLLSLPNEQLVEKIMSGIRKSEIQEEKKMHLYEMMDDHYPFYLDPMPNLYFTRDPAAVIGNGISINRMSRGARRRESLFIDYIIRYHPRFASHKIPIWFERNYRFSIEGGDILVLNKNVLAVGVSERTTAQAIEHLALNLFDKQKDIQKVVAVEIPKSRAFMHLDTVFTMVDREKFTVHPGILGPHGEMRIYILEPGEEKGTIKISERNNLIKTLKEVLELQEVVLIPCGGGDSIASAREQWNDGSNTLAIAPGVVVTYDRNYVSNQQLRDYGVEVIEVPSSELSRGRGGPRCMSMPLIREDI
ncbi:arginine deiminase [Thermolongibacillus altinsuensis]|uniref:arginine deiminase n=1 Tax=Thermolongibacillus altinsuensis TaxID=575256 RepID=UPI00242A31DF|nr:arginine deiminase [Thermolongibacillus altinsuensis]GMB09957.1 arginine deiminase [Thermolongibacillus altinsuensis]